MKKYDEEEVVSIMQEIEWRDKQINELEEYVHIKKIQEQNKNKPKNWTRILSIGFVTLVISGLPVFAYGRNAWQSVAYYINKSLWVTKDWWY
tara:strand:- start:391 stop:666 length:276 start_codon:yes stop_codon:yes gene_type:complete